MGGGWEAGAEAADWTLYLPQLLDPSGTTPPTSPQRYFRNFEEWGLGSLCPQSWWGEDPLFHDFLQPVLGGVGLQLTLPEASLSTWLCLSHPLLLPAPPAAPSLHPR